MPIKKKKNTKTKPLLLVLVIVTVFGSGIYYFQNKDSANNSGPIAEVADPQDEINYNPPSEEEKQAGDQTKQRIVTQEEQQNSNQNQGSKKPVTPVVANANATNVSAYVPGVFEEGGTCTAVFSKNGGSVTRTSQGFGNVSYTQCAPITPDLPSTGGWTVTITYESAAAKGTSQSAEVQ